MFERVRFAFGLLSPHITCTMNSTLLKTKSTSETSPSPLHPSKDDSANSDRTTASEEESSFPLHIIEKCGMVVLEENGERPKATIILNSSNSSQDFVYVGDGKGDDDPFFRRYVPNEKRRQVLMKGYLKAKRKQKRGVDFKISYEDACLFGDWAMIITLDRVGKLLRQLSILLHEQLGEEVLFVLSHDNVYDIFEPGYEFPSIRVCRVREAEKLPLITQSDISSVFMECLRTKPTRVGERFLMVHVFRKRGKVAQLVPSCACLYNWRGSVEEDSGARNVPAFVPREPVECAHCHVKLSKGSGVHCPDCVSTSYCGPRCMKEHEIKHRRQCVTTVHWMYCSRMEAEHAYRPVAGTMAGVGVHDAVGLKPLNLSVLKKRLLPHVKRWLYRFCDVCQCALDKPQTCSACRKPSYCSKTCQSKHWRMHRKDCIPTKVATPVEDIHAVS